MITVSECISKNESKPVLKPVNPFKFIKEHSNSSYIIGRFIYEQEPCQVSIEYIVDEPVTTEELSELMGITLSTKILRRNILYIPYSVFENYMDGLISDYVDNCEHQLYNKVIYDSIYSYDFIAIDLRR